MIVLVKIKRWQNYNFIRCSSIFKNRHNCCRKALNFPHPLIRINNFYRNFLSIICSSMETTSLFLNYLRKFVHLTDEEYIKMILPISKIRRYGKREFVTKAGEVEDYFNFIIKGLVRKFYKKNNHEINTQISMEGHIILSQESFHSRTPSEYYVETIEPTVFLSIHYDDLEKTYTHSKKMEHLGRLVVTHTMMIK